MIETRHVNCSNKQKREESADLVAWREWERWVASQTCILVHGWMAMPTMNTQAKRGEASLNEGC